MEKKTELGASLLIYHLNKQIIIMKKIINVIKDVHKCSIILFHQVFYDSIPTTQNGIIYFQWYYLYSEDNLVPR